MGILLAACRQEMVYEVKDRPIPAAAQKALDGPQMERLIIQAAMAKNWRVDVVKPGHPRATLHIRDKHTAVSDIRFQAQSYSILLNSSNNLKQDYSGHIHRSYNRVVRALEDEIDRSLYRASY
jgi:hypothetical protein